MSNQQLINLKEKFIKEITSSAIQDFQLQPIKLLSEELFIEKAQLQAQEEFDFFFHKVHQGCHDFFQSIDKFKEEDGHSLDSIMKHIQQNLLKLNRNRDENTQSSLFGEEIQRYWGTTHEERSKLYFFAKKMFEKKDFEKSSGIFLTLTLLFPQISEFWLGFGAAEKEQGHWETASIMCMQAILLNPQLIEAYLCAIECYVAQGSSDLATEVLYLLFENNPKDEIDPFLINKINEVLR